MLKMKKRFAGQLALQNSQDEDNKLWAEILSRAAAPAVTSGKTSSGFSLGALGKQLAETSNGGTEDPLHRFWSELLNPGGAVSAVAQGSTLTEPAATQQKGNTLYFDRSDPLKKPFSAPMSAKDIQTVTNTVKNTPLPEKPDAALVKSFKNASQSDDFYEMYRTQIANDPDVIMYYQSFGQDATEALKRHPKTAKTSLLELYYEIKYFMRSERNRKAANKAGDELYRQQKAEEEANLQMRAKLQKEGEEEPLLEILRTPGILDDGYQFGDLTKLTLGNAADLAVNAFRGVASMGENLGTAIASGVADVSDLVGADDFAYKIRNNIANDLIGETFGDFDDAINEYLDENSFYGRTLDSVAQGVGQLWGQAGAYAVHPVVGDLVTAGSGYGGAYAEALQEGATPDEARVYASISAAVELGTEKIAGGMGKFADATGVNVGVGGLDDKVARKLTSKLTNATLKNLAEYGIKASGEGFEEVLSGIGSAVAKKLTYMSEEELVALIEDENLLESFLVGTMTSAIGQSGDLKRANFSGRDFITDLTDPETKVVNKVYEDRVRQTEESTGEKLSAKDKNKLYESTVEDMKKGYIPTEVIEEVLAGETYRKYSESSKQKTAMQKEYDELYGMRNGDKSDAQRDQQADLKTRLAALDTDSIRSKLDSEISPLIKDSYLAESYNERTRRSQTFETDITQYKNEYARKTVQNIVDSGVVNNTNRTRELVDLMAKISADREIVFNVADAKKLKDTGFGIDNATVNGYFDGEGITININSSKALNTIVGHEITHALEGTEFYDTLKDTVIRYAQDTGDYNSRMAALRKIYSGKEGYTSDFENKLNKELVADLIGDYVFTDTDFINNLSTKNRNLFQKLYDEIKYLAKIATAGSKEARELEKIKKRFEEAYRKTKNTAQPDGVKYSLKQFEDGTRFVEIDQEQDRFNGHSVDDYPRIAKDIINEKFNHKVIGIDNKMYVNSAGRDEFANPSKRISDDLYEVKMRTAGELDNLLDAGTNFRNKPDGEDGHHHPDVIDGFDYFDTIFKIGDNYFKAVINIKNIARGKLFKDVTKIEDVTQDIMSSYGKNPKSQFLRTSSVNIIRKESGNVNQKLSLSEDAGGNVPTGENIYGADVAVEQDLSGYTQGERELFGVLDAIRNGTDQQPSTETSAPATEQPDQIRTVKERNDAIRQNLETELLKNTEMQQQTLADYDQHIADLQQKYDAMKNRDTVTANKLYQQIERQKRLRNNVDAAYQKRISDLSERIEKMNSAEFKRSEQRQAMEEKRTAMIENLIGDTSTWVDKKHGLSYMTNTLKRNLRDIVRDDKGNRDIKKADRIYEEIQGKYNRNEAKLNRELNKLRQKYADLKISKAEDVYIQMLGEHRHNPSTTLTEETVKEYYEKHKKNIDTKKVDKVIEMARKDYDSLIKRVNEVLRINGMKEIPYRQGYFPHFTQDKQGPLAKLLNWKTKSDDIPTDIAGLTEQFEPVRSYQSFNKQRTTDITDYSFKKGFDQYSFGAMDWIYHIEDIQKRRALENHIRYVHSEEGVKARIDAIKANEEYDADEAQEQIDLVYREARNPLNNFVIDLRRGTQTLAGKKSSLDREVEYSTNRKIYSTMTNISNRVSANMVAGSISAAMTNFIPITQSWGEVKPTSSIRAMGQTLKTIIRDDGVVDKSDFLTNRLRKAENLHKTNWDKTSDVISFLMDTVDNFTSQTVWRSKYNENMDAGMSEADAIQNADNFTEGVMAGRSRGNIPTVFDSKNPLIKLATAFQLEVNNQYGYLFKDMPQDMQEQSKAKLIGGYASVFLGAYAYNALLSNVTGRTAAFDPIRIVEELLKDMGVGDDEEDDGEIKWSEILGNLTENVLQEVPFVGSFLGGGRVPISSALPYDSLPETLTGTIKDIEEQDWANLTKEWMNPVYYLLMPMGGGQIKKSVEGLSMFTGGKKISGSYTTDGKLRYPVEATPGNVLQAGLFGQWANENARDYINQNRQPLSLDKYFEYARLNVPIQQYWEIQDGLKGLSTQAEKAEYIASLDLSVDQKNLLINNLVNRPGKIDMTNYGDFSGWEDFDFYNKYPEKYGFLKRNNISVAQYNAFGEEEKAAWSWAYDNPEKYQTSKAVTDDIMEFREWMADISEIKADKDKNGNPISGSAKEKKVKYLNSLPLKAGQRIIFYKMLFPSDNTYNRKLLDYVNKQSNMTYRGKKQLLEYLGFTVADDGTVTWD